MGLIALVRISGLYFVLYHLLKNQGQLLALIFWVLSGEIKRIGINPGPKWEGENHHENTLIGEGRDQFGAMDDIKSPLLIL